MVRCCWKTECTQNLFQLLRSDWNELKKTYLNTASQILRKAVTSEFCHSFGVHSEPDSSLQHNSHRLWITTYISFLAGVSFLSTDMNTCLVFTTMASKISNQTTFAQEECTADVSLKVRWLIICSAAAHLTACKCTCKCHFGAVRYCCGVYYSIPLTAHYLPVTCGLQHCACFNYLFLGNKGPFHNDTFLAVCVNSCGWQFLYMETVWHCVALREQSSP